MTTRRPGAAGPRARLCLILAAAVAPACSRAHGGGGGDSRSRPRDPSPPVSSPSAAPVGARPAAVTTARRLTAVAEVGKRLFFDKALSASGSQSCATCHDPDHAYGPPDGRAVQLGGPRGTSPGLRAVPSLRYQEYTRGYSDLLDNPDGFSEPGPGGGFAWDGRADSLAEQASAPLLSPFEMANADAADVARKVRAAPYADLFRRAFGPRSLDDGAPVLEKVGAALQAFQLEDPSFHPYTSKFDLHVYQRPGGAFTAAEERGFKVFTDARKGNCNSCHLPDPSMDDGAPALFTDFSYEAIGVPRNPEIPANRDRRYADLGVCGPLRRDHLHAPAFCGLFKTPSLRNVATRRAFFHNGAIHSLEQAVRFYNTRDTMPELWYPTVGGRRKDRPDARFPRYGLVTAQYVGGVVQKFDDLPRAYRGNVDAQLPLDGRAAGSRPPMTDQDVADLVAFLETLTDGYQPTLAQAVTPVH